MSNILFIMDPIESVHFLTDTSYCLMKGAAKRGHRLFYCQKTQISQHNNDVYFQLQEVVHLEPKITLKKLKKVPASKMDIIFIRSDPPFDQQYLLMTWLLDPLPYKKIAIINSPSGLRNANEKLWAMQFKDLMPDTLVTRDKDQLNAFIAQYPHTIVKPLNGYGGKGVFKCAQSDSNRHVILETISNGFTEEIIIQAYLKESEIGDKRILLLEGEPLGALLRQHTDSDHRNNFYAGGKALPAVVSEQDQVIIDSIKPYLLENGLYFVGIDVIGDKLIEVNVTSPTCLQEMNRLYKKQLEYDVIDFAERKHTSLT